MIPTLKYAWLTTKHKCMLEDLRYQLNKAEKEAAPFWAEALRTIASRDLTGKASQDSEVALRFHIGKWHVFVTYPYVHEVADTLEAAVAQAVAKLESIE